MNRILYFDVLNVISCISVVCLHSNGFIHEFAKDDWWWLRVMIEVLCYFAVPVFFMLSGSTLMQYRQRYSTWTFYKKRFSRTIVPYVFWGGLFYLLPSLLKGTFGWHDMIMRFTTGSITNYWFFIPLFTLYIFMPFLSLMVINMTKKAVLALCGLLFVFQSLMPTVYMLFGLELRVPMPIGGYFLFALLGYYFSITKWDENRLVLSLIGILATLSVMIRYYFIYVSDEKNSQLFTYFGLYSIIPAVFIFLLIKKCANKMDSHNNSIWIFLSHKTLGVYLIHTYLIYKLMLILDWTNILFVPISVVVVYSLSILIVAALQKNKYGRFIMP